MPFSKCNLLLISLLLSFTACCQAHFTIDGYINDSATGERIIRGKQYSYAGQSFNEHQRRRFGSVQYMHEQDEDSSCAFLMR